MKQHTAEEPPEAVGIAAKAPIKKLNISALRSTG